MISEINMVLVPLQVATKKKAFNELPEAVQCGARDSLGALVSLEGACKRTLRGASTLQDGMVECTDKAASGFSWGFRFRFLRLSADPLSAPLSAPGEDRSDASQLGVNDVGRLAVVEVGRDSAQARNQ